MEKVKKETPKKTTKAKKSVEKPKQTAKKKTTETSKVAKKSSALSTSREKDYKVQIDAQKAQIELLKLRVDEKDLEAKKIQDEYKAKALDLETKLKELVEVKRQEMEVKFQAETNEKLKYSSQRTLQSILKPILLLEKAIENGKSQSDPKIYSYVQGFTMLIEQFFNQLQLEGVTRIAPQVGERFNPSLHEVVATSPGVVKDTILEVKQFGIQLHDRVLIPAQVVVCI